jgi:hypothetical protein
MEGQDKPANGMDARVQTRRYNHRDALKRMLQQEAIEFYSQWLHDQDCIRVDFEAMTVTIHDDIVSGTELELRFGFTTWGNVRMWFADEDAPEDVLELDPEEVEGGDPQSRRDDLPPLKMEP